MHLSNAIYRGPSRTTYGLAEIWEVEEIAYKNPLSAMTTDAALIAALPDWLRRDWIDAEGCVDVVHRSWILIVDGRVIVVDPCTGNGRDFPAFLPAHQLDTPYIERFAATGIRPEDVDFVFCTHLHMDHCGWNTVLRDGRYVPTFPNAQYVMVQRELDRWDTRRPGHVPVPQNAGVFENSVLPVIEAGLARIVGERHAILPGLEVEPSHGHTAGHSSLHLTSDGRHAHFVGDLFHHPIELLHPDLQDFTYEDFGLLLQSRRALLDTALRQDALIVPAHFHCPFGGHLRQGEEGLTFAPWPAG